VLKGVLAASVTPLAQGGAALDEDGFGPVADFLVAGGLDGLLALGTNGEGILLSVAERKRAAELFVEAAAGRLQVAVHAGAQYADAQPRACILNPVTTPPPPEPYIQPMS